ncbi:MAG: GerMN domain-containing protein [Bacillota bacterium]
MARAVSLLFLALLIITTGGCGNTALPDELRHELQAAQEENATLQAEVDQLLASLELYQKSPLVTAGGDLKVVCYFGLVTQYDIGLVPVLRPVAAQNLPDEDHALKRAALQELIAGPRKGSNLTPVLPTDAQILDFTVQDGLATVNLDEAAKKYAGGSTGEAIVIAAIVNTLTEFPDIDQVQILLHGQTDASLGGHFILDEHFRRQENMILD